MKWIPAIALILGLTAACSSEQTNPDEILGYLRETNLNGGGETPFPSSGPTFQILKRWDFETALIPVKLNGSTLAAAALDQIEATLGLLIFDRTSIANAPEGNITRGIIVSIGTTPSIGSGRACGTVSDGPNQTSFPPNSLEDDGEITGRWYVNLGSAQCEPELGVTIHEFGHVLGLGAHFSGFGEPDAIDQSFWDTLFTLYHNPIGSLEANIKVVTGARRVP